MSDRIINYDTDWQGHSGSAVQEFIKDRLQGMERGKQDTLSLGTGLVMTGSELSVSLSTSQIEGMEHEVGRIAALETSKQDAISLGTGLEWSGDTMGLMLGEGLSVDACGRIVAEGETYTAGSGVDILDDNTIAISTGYGLDVNESNQLTVQTVEYSPIVVTQDGLDINYGTGLANTCGTLMLDNSYIGLPNKVSNIELSLQLKQNKLTAGSGIAIEDGQNISLKVATGLEYNDDGEVTVNISTKQVSGIEEYVAFVASDKQDKLAYYSEGENIARIIASNEILLDTGQTETGTYLQLIDGLGAAFGYGEDVGIVASADGIKLSGNVSVGDIANLEEVVNSKMDTLAVGTGLEFSANTLEVQVGGGLTLGNSGIELACTYLYLPDRVDKMETSIANKQDTLHFSNDFYVRDNTVYPYPGDMFRSIMNEIAQLSNSVANKQDALTAGTGIKLNNTTGNISVSISTEQVDGLAGVVTALEDSISNKQDQLQFSCDFNVDGKYVSLSYQNGAISEVFNHLDTKQNKLTAGTGIKLSGDTISVSIGTDAITGMDKEVDRISALEEGKQDAISVGDGLAMYNNQISLSCEIVALPSIVEGKQDALQIYKENGTSVTFDIPDSLYMETYSGRAAFTMADYGAISITGCNDIALNSPIIQIGGGCNLIHVSNCGIINLTAPRVEVNGSLFVGNTNVMNKIANKMDWFSIGYGLRFDGSQLRLPNLASSLHNGAVDKAGSSAQKVLNLSCGSITIKLATGLGIDKCGYLYVL